MSDAREIIPGVFPEQSTRLIRFQLVDEDGTGIGPPVLETLRWTHCDPNGAVLNGRLDVNILNANGGTIDSEGNGELLIPSFDLVMGNQRHGAMEDRISLIEWTHNSGRRGSKEIWYRLINLRQVG